MDTTLTAERNERWYFLPSQIIQHDESVLVRRGVIKIEISGEDVFDLVKTLMILMSEDGATETEIVDYFGTGLSGAISSLLNELRSKGFVVKDAERQNLITSEPKDLTRSNLFYWNIGCDSEKKHDFEKTRFRILGVNHISRHMFEALMESGIADVQAIDYPLLRNVDFFDDTEQIKAGAWKSEFKPRPYSSWLDDLEFDEFDCLICTSDFGGMYALREFNKFCIDNDLTFFPVILQDFNGYIGPLTVPHETCCYECFLQRQNSNLSNYEKKRKIELSDFEGQEAIGFHPLMATSLADIAVFELIKFI